MDLKPGLIVIINHIFDAFHKPVKGALIKQKINLSEINDFLTVQPLLSSLCCIYISFSVHEFH